MEVGLLDALAMVPLGVGQAEQPFLEEGVFLVPESEGDVLVAMGIANASNAVLTPSVCARACVVVREI
jgi:hypothetical protein